MRIAAVSFNMDAQPFGPARFPELFNDRDSSAWPDIYAEFTQEDSRSAVKANPNDKMVLIPNDYIPIPGKYGSVLGSYKLLASKALNSGQSGSAQNVKLSLWSPRKPSKIESGAIPVKISSSFIGSLAYGGQSIGSAFGVSKAFSKGTVWIHVYFPNTDVLFVNMHLPVNVKDDQTLGLDYRREVFYKALKELKSRITPSTVLLVGGDLNFRMMQGIDQLKYSIDSFAMPLKLKELESESMPYTCKMKPESNTTCRLTPISAGGKRNCADPDRDPSRCDRFLVLESIPTNLKLITTKVLNPKSDHNAIVTVFESGPEPEDFFGAAPVQKKGWFGRGGRRSTRAKRAQRATKKRRGATRRLRL